MTETLFNEADVIYNYTRQQAIEDGVLADVTPIAKMQGFKFPVALTTGVYAEVIEDPDAQAEAFNLRQLLTQLHLYIKLGKANGDRLDFSFNGHELYSLCHAGDNFEPVITIMLIGED